MIVSGATTKDIWRKLTDDYQKENIQSILNLRTKLHNLRYKDTEDLKKYLTDIEIIFVDLTPCNELVTDKYKTGVLLRSLPKRFGFVSSMPDANNMDYDFICALLKSEMKRRKAHHNPTASIIPAARNAESGRDRANDRKRHVECWYYSKFGHLKLECR